MNNTTTLLNCNIVQSSVVAINKMNTTVVKIQRKGGEVVQGCDIYIGRACNMGGWRLKQSEWHNPFKVSKDMTKEQVLEKYEERIRKSDILMSKLNELDGKVLGCWCKPQSCHGDILVKLINEKNSSIGNV